jgi:hypothetical protein
VSGWHGIREVYVDNTFVRLRRLVSPHSASKRERTFSTSSFRDSDAVADDTGLQDLANADLTERMRSMMWLFGRVV